MLPECPHAVIQKTLFSDDEYQDLLNWFRENVRHSIWRASKPRMTGVSLPGQVSFAVDGVEAIWCFEDKQEALLFKLTWGGEL